MLITSFEFLLDSQEQKIVTKAKRDKQDRMLMITKVLTAVELEMFIKEVLFH